MTLATSRHRKRKIALTMLFVWVFVLVSGVANACMTEPGGVAHAAVAVEHPRHAEKAPCEKSCDESTRTLLKQAPKLDTGDQQSIVSPSRAWGEGPLAAPAAEARAAVTAVAPPSPPARVQFSRLAL